MAAHEKAPVGMDNIRDLSEEVSAFRVEELGFLGQEINILSPPAALCGSPKGKNKSGGHVPL